MNLWLYLIPPQPLLTAPSPLPGLPPSPVHALAGTAYATEVIRLAGEVLAGKLRILGTTIRIDGGISWRRDPIHGQELGILYFRRIPYLDFTRAGDHKLIWEMSRHQHLVLLAQAWQLDGQRPEYLEAITEQLESWREQNPFQCGMNWTSALEVAFRAWSWIWIWHLCGAAMPKAKQTAMLRSLYQHGCHLEYNLSVYFSPNTHLLGEAVVLHALGYLFPDWPAAASWRQRGGTEVERQTKLQVLADGAHFELSSYYHVYALDMLMAHCLLAYNGAGPMKETLRQMGYYLYALMTPERKIPLLGDDDGGRFFHPYGIRRQFGRATLATAALLLGEENWPHDPHEVAEQAAWWLGGEVAAIGLQHPVLGRPSGPRQFTESGLVRLGDGVRTHVLFDAGGFGPFQGGHSHSDALHITLWARGEELLIDPGTYTYISDPVWRNRFRGSSGHNTLRINGLDQSNAVGPFAWLGRPSVHLEEATATGAVAVCRVNGFTHRRQVELDGADWLLVKDRVEGPPGEHLVEQFWHLAKPGLEDRLRVPAGEALEWTEGGELGWRSEVLGSREPVPVARRWRSGELPWEWRTAIALSPGIKLHFPSALFDEKCR